MLENHKNQAILPERLHLNIFQNMNLLYYGINAYFHQHIPRGFYAHIAQEPS